MFIYVVCAAFPRGIFRYGITGTWYSDLFRLSALLPCVVVPLGAIGFGALVALAARLAAPRARRVLALGLAVGGSAVVMVATQLGQPMSVAVASASAMYRITAESPLLTTSERALIDRLPEHVAPADVIVGSPWTGTSLSYALVNRRALVPHIYQVLDRDSTLIVDHLDQAASDPAVCAALARTRTRWVLDFGTQEVHGGSHGYPGLADIASSGVVTLVDSQGPDAKLYRITACG